MAPQRGPLGADARRADARADDRRHVHGRGAAAGEAQRGVHDPHAGIGRQRALRQQPRPTARRAARRGQRPRPGTHHRARPRHGQRRQSVRHDGVLAARHERRERREPLHAQTANATWTGIVDKPILGHHQRRSSTVWVGDPFRRLYEAIGGDLDNLDAEENPFWDRIKDLPDASSGRRTSARSSSSRSSAAAGCSSSSRVMERRRASSKISRDALDPDLLTIGFARRFATYKRAALIFTDEERLARHPAQRRAARPDRVRRQGASRRPPRPARHPGHLQQQPLAQVREARLRARGLRHPRRAATSSRASTCG